MNYFNQPIHYNPHLPPYYQSNSNNTHSSNNMWQQSSYHLSQVQPFFPQHLHQVPSQPDVLLLNPYLPYSPKLLATSNDQIVNVKNYKEKMNALRTVLGECDFISLKMETGEHVVNEMDRCLAQIKAAAQLYSVLRIGLAANKFVDGRWQQSEYCIYVREERMLRGGIKDDAISIHRDKGRMLSITGFDWSAYYNTSINLLGSEADGQQPNQGGYGRKLSDSVYPLRKFLEEVLVSKRLVMSLTDMMYLLKLLGYPMPTAVTELAVLLKAKRLSFYNLQTPFGIQDPVFSSVKLGEHFSHNMLKGGCDFSYLKPFEDCFSQIMPQPLNESFPQLVVANLEAEEKKPIESESKLEESTNPEPKVLSTKATGTTKSPNPVASQQIKTETIDEALNDKATLETALVDEVSVIHLKKEDQDSLKNISRNNNSEFKIEKAAAGKPTNKDEAKITKEYIGQEEEKKPEEKLVKEPLVSGPKTLKSSSAPKTVEAEESKKQVIDLRHSSGSITTSTGVSENKKSKVEKPARTGAKPVIPSAVKKLSPNLNHRTNQTSRAVSQSKQQQIPSQASAAPAPSTTGQLKKKNKKLKQ